MRNDDPHLPAGDTRRAPNHPPNRLAGQTSPYLLQHAQNPVDWYPWGPEDFAEARRRDVPIFLSIGYSTCYWCHVMERESFENPAVGAIMSERFVCVKVDREERPDVDDIYMAAVQTMTGRGGWPMSVFLEPGSLKPFWAGTYYPPRPMHGLPSFAQVLEGMSQAWREQRENVLKQAAAVADAVRERLGLRHGPVPVGNEQILQAASALLTSFDRTRGGFGGAPKFPQTAYLDFLLEFRPFAGDEPTARSAEAALRLTLDRIALGGIRDHVGGGFHRYSVDAEWIVPHFEKMLYDQALLMSTFTRAARVLDDPFYLGVAQDTAEYVLKEMTSAQGGFFTAQDAEVAGREGLNYLWTPDEIRRALPPAEAELAIRLFSLDSGTNFQDPHHPDAPPANVLRLEVRLDAMAARLDLPPGQLERQLPAIRAGLYAARHARPQPSLDDKILTAWNGLMIAAMAQTGRETGDARLLDAARRAARFVLTSMRDDSGTLLRSWRQGRAQIPAFLDDSAAMIAGLLALHHADPSPLLADTTPLRAAQDLLAAARRDFGDGSGAMADTRDPARSPAATGPDLFVRPRSTYDGAVPSGLSMMLHNLIDLHEITADRRHLQEAVAALGAISSGMVESPIATINATRALLRLLALDKDILESALGRPEPPTPIGPAAVHQRVPVEIFASEERLAVGRETPASVTLKLRIAPEYHINAADPAPGRPDLARSLIPLRVTIIGGTGIAAYADYPAGESYGQDGELRVHRGELDLEVALERAGDWAGRPLLAVMYQACTDQSCDMPRTVELDVAIDPID